MDEILKMSISEMAGKSFECTCGRHHSIDIDSIYIGNGVLDKTIEVCLKNSKSRLFLMADENTYQVCGRHVEDLLKVLDIKTFVYPKQGHDLVPDEKSLGRLLIEFDSNTDLILVIGSGVLNDLGKLLSYRVGVPYIIVGTAPSMDGYASVVSPLIVDGVKITVPTTYPLSIIGDTSIMKKAPMEMLQAGFGDIIGKITALADWRLAKEVIDETYCETCVKIVENALEKCLNNADGLYKREEKAVRYVMEGLVLSGIAIGLNGDSRPASGAEHNFAHYWDMDAISRGMGHPLHGNSVAVGTVISAYVYDMVKDELPGSIDLPDVHMIEDKLLKLKSTVNPKDLGIPKDLFEKSMKEAMDLKERYTVFHFAREIGKLDEITEKLVEKFYIRQI